MKNKNNNITLIVVLSTILFTLAVFLPQKVSGVAKLSGADFLKKSEEIKGSVLLDVRTEAEYLEGHIDKAINMNFQSSTFRNDITTLDPSKTYFVYCRSGNRSGQAVAQMKSAGINHIYELEGGILSNKTLPLVTGVAKVPEYVVDKSDMIDSKTLTVSTGKTELSSEEKAGLIRMREEEKLARDVCTTLSAIWGSKIFSNIASSEQTHTDAVKALLVRYNISDPVTSDTVGVFASMEMKNLYDTLVAQGKVSRAQALTVGAIIEDLDINDLENLKKQTTKEDILITYNNLQKGSRNHMRAFVRNLEAEGVTYVPKYISQTTYESIINSAQERGQR